MTPSSATEPKHTNHLIHETSPYLLQHAHNPVNWYPWGEEALNKARREDKPILLSIGYAACHWCHVMERESFENEEIAALMNEHFVNVKVDREERPDLDALYMLAVQMLAGQGGWPMTVFLTPALHPFYGGTYFPPTDLYGRPGFPRVLRAMAEYYHREKEDLVERTSKIEEMIRQVSRAGTAGELPDEATMTQAFHQLEARYDRIHGGFGSAPKFPQPSMIEFLLRFADRTGERDARTMSLSTLRQMAEGGLYDHLGGGFHRYSTDERWLVPHFEKMLYDNALLPPLYLAAYTMTGEERFAATARGTLEYVLRDMRSDEGGFYSSEDADSEGVEGKFYVWSRDEIESILGAEDAQLFCAYYGVTAQGNWEGANILHVAEEVASAAERLSVSEEALRAALSEGRRALFEARERRTRPAQDDKILTGWNGLMIAALAQGGATLDEPRYLDAAERAARFILDRLSRDGRLLRAYRGGHAKIEGFLEDYAYFVRGLLDLFEASQEARWLREADRLAEQMIALFWDDDAGGFFTTSAHHERLLTRLKDSHDGATPSGNSLAIGVLQRLAILTGKTTYAEKARQTLAAFAKVIRETPSAFPEMLVGLDAHLHPMRETVIIGGRDEEDTRRALRLIRSAYLPNHVLVLYDPSEASPILAETPLVQGRQALEGKPTFYVCENFACQAPTTSVDALADRLGIETRP